MIGDNGGQLQLTNWLLGALVPEYQTSDTARCVTYDMKVSIGPHACATRVYHTAVRVLSKCSKMNIGWSTVHVVCVGVHGPNTLEAI